MWYSLLYVNELVFASWVFWIYSHEDITFFTVYALLKKRVTDEHRINFDNQTAMFSRH